MNPHEGGFNLTPILEVAIPLIAAALGWIASYMRRKQQAADDKSKVESTLLRLGEFVVLLAGKSWTEMSPTLKRVMADGKVTAEEKDEIEALVGRMAAKYAEKETLEEFARILKLPFPGLIALITEKVIKMFASAHDANVGIESAKSFPVPEETSSSFGGNITDAERPPG